MNLESLVQTHFDILTPTDYYIWQYISSHSQECQHCSISAVAEQCHVSAAAITRFTKKVGLSGFAELKMALKWQIEGIPVPASNLLDRSTQDYQLTIDYLKHRNYDNIFSLLDQSQTIFAFGTGEVQRHAAKEFKRLFLNVHRQVFMIEGMAELSSAIRCAESQDLFIIFSLSGNNAAANQHIREIRKRGTHILTVTSYEDNALAKLGDANLYYYNHCILKGRVPGTDCHLSAQFFLITEILFIKYLEYLHTQQS